MKILYSMFWLKVPNGILFGILLCFSLFLIILLLNQTRRMDHEKEYKQRIELQIEIEQSIKIAMGKKKHIETQIERQHTQVIHINGQDGPDMEIGKNPGVHIQTEPYNFLEQEESPPKKLRPWSKPNSRKHPDIVAPVDVLVVVCSAVSNFGARTAIRSSWGRETKILPQVKIVFLMGTLKRDKTNERTFEIIQKHLKSENSSHGDILQEGFIDTYKNLTLKSMALLQYVSKSCQDNLEGRECPRFVLKADDDMYINLATLWSLTQKITQKYVLLGALICGSERHPTNPKNKWFIPDNHFTGSAYPPFLSGTSYLMSLHTVMALNKAAQHHRPFPLEVVFLTGIMAQAVGLRTKDHPGFSFKQRELDVWSVRKTITTHGVSTKEIAARTHLTGEEDSAFYFK